MTAAEFNDIVYSCRDRMYRLSVTILRDRADAEDVTQDVLGKLWQMRGKLDGCANLGAYIHTTVRNHCLDRLRRGKIRRNDGETLSLPDGVSEDVRHDWRDMHRIMERVMAELPDKQQLVVQMRDIEGCEFEQTARVAGMNEAAVRVTLGRARKRIKEEMLKTMNHGID